MKNKWILHHILMRLKLILIPKNRVMNSNGTGVAIHSTFKLCKDWSPPSNISAFPPRVLFKMMQLDSGPAILNWPLYSEMFKGIFPNEGYIH
jgi:hypothetical protein